jgi:hypothetical protein
MVCFFACFIKNEQKLLNTIFRNHSTKTRKMISNKNHEWSILKLPRKQATAKSYAIHDFYLFFLFNPGSVP